ncbi:toprim domain-containing protein [Lactococcus garvieae]|uniref:toprim domain-containing protein n=1 Tax=Lactococcus garvieae TaxID=1363 RepID=UPI002549CD7D|nr:toprim domain-containing protein [Lactococcus garvieae]
MAYKRPQKSRVSTHKERKRLAQEAKNKDIFAVAQQLGMKVQRDGSAEWDGHTTFWLDRKKNRFQWYSQGLWGDPTTLVSVIQFGARSVEDYKTNYTKSIAYLTNTEVPQFDQSKIPKAAPFKYYLKDAASMQLATDYLINERGISPETVQFFKDKGVLTQSVWRNRLDDDSIFTEPVVVFKHFDGNNKMIGGSVQGIEYHPDIHTDHKSGHLKRVIKNSGAYSGLAVDIGQPQRIVVCEAPIDLLSYYDLHKESLKDVKLISSDGYKPHVLSRYVAEMYGNPDLSLSEKEKFLEKFDKLSKTMSGYPENLITFAYDNDEAGRVFIDQFKAHYSNAEAYTAIDLPPLKLGANKADWNDELKTIKKEAQQGASFFSPSKGEMHVEQNRTTNLNFSDFEDEGYSLTESLENAIYILPDGKLWSGYYPEAPEVRAVEHREIEVFIENSDIDRGAENFWPLVLNEAVMVIPEREALLYLESANYTEAQKQKINDYKKIGWEITHEEGKNKFTESRDFQLGKDESALYSPDFISELNKLETYAEGKGLYLWTQNENWMSDPENDEGEQFLFDEGVYAASAYEFESVAELDEWLKNEEVLVTDGLGHIITFTELKQELLQLEATDEKGEKPLKQDKKEEIQKLELEQQELTKNFKWEKAAAVNHKLKFLRLEQEVIDTGNPQLIHDQITKTKKEIGRREDEAYYSDSWEQSAKIREDIAKLEGSLVQLQNLSQSYPLEIAKTELEKNADQQTKTSEAQGAETSQPNPLDVDPDINRYEQIIQEQQESLNQLQSQFTELTKQNALILEKLNQKSVENTEEDKSMKKVGLSSNELAFIQIPQLIQQSKEKLSEVKNHIKDNIKHKSQKGLSATLEKLKVLEILEAIKNVLDTLSHKVQNLDTQLKVLSGKQVDEKELLLLPAPIQEAAEEIVQQKNVKIGEPTRPQNKFEERLAKAKIDNKTTAENYANQKQAVEVSQRAHK